MADLTPTEYRATSYVNRYFRREIWGIPIPAEVLRVGDVVWVGGADSLLNGRNPKYAWVTDIKRSERFKIAKVRFVRYGWFGIPTHWSEDKLDEDVLVLHTDTLLRTGSVIR